MRKIIRGTVGKTNSTKSSKFASRLKRIEKQQTAHDIVFETEASAATTCFEETVSALFGTFGLGKTTFAAELGFALQKKYNLPQNTYTNMAYIKGVC